MEDGKEYIEINITLSIVMDINNVSRGAVDDSMRLMIDDITDRYIDYRIKYQCMDLDIETENKIYVKFTAYSITGSIGESNLNKVGENSVVNFRHRLMRDKSLSEYKVEKVDFGILKAESN